MADVFTTSDVLALLKDKTVVFIGDSNVRGMYKDLLWLSNQNTLINYNCLRRKLEKSYLGDQLVKSSDLTKSRDFYEVRSFKGFNHKLKFYFVTRCYCDTIINYLKEVREKTCPPPDVIIMNSCLWDVTRWGPNGVEDYKVNMVKLMELLRISLPARTLFIWGTAFPISLSSIRGGLIIKQIEFMERSLRFHIMEANLFSRNLVNSYGFDVVDFHFHLQFQISRRSCDGVHYLPLPVRLQTNLLLTHIALSWGRALPNKGDLMLIEDEKSLASGKTAVDFSIECFNSWANDDMGNNNIYASDNDAFSRGPPTKGGTNLTNSCTEKPPPLFPNGIISHPTIQSNNNSGWSNNYSSNNNRSPYFRVSFPKRSFSLNQDAVRAAGCIMREPPSLPGLVPPPAPWQPALYALEQQINYYNPPQLEYQQFKSNIRKPNKRNKPAKPKDNQAQPKDNQAQPTPQTSQNQKQPQPLRTKSQLKRLQRKRRANKANRQKKQQAINLNNCGKAKANAFLKMFFS